MRWRSSVVVLQTGAVPGVVTVVYVAPLVLLAGVELNFGHWVVAAVDEASAVEEVEGTGHVWADKGARRSEKQKEEEEEVHFY